MTGTPGNPLIAPVPCLLKTGRTRAADGGEVAVLTIQHPAGELVVLLTKAEADSWADSIKVTTGKMSGLTLPGSTPLPFPPNGHPR